MRSQISNAQKLQMQSNVFGRKSTKAFRSSVTYSGCPSSKMQNLHAKYVCGSKQAVGWLTALILNGCNGKSYGIGLLAALQCFVGSHSRVAESSVYLSFAPFSFTKVYSVVSSSLIYQ